MAENTANASPDDLAPYGTATDKARYRRSDRMISANVLTLFSQAADRGDTRAMAHKELRGTLSTGGAANF